MPALDGCRCLRNRTMLCRRVVLGRLGLALGNALVAWSTLDDDEPRRLVPKNVTDDFYPTPSLVVEDLDDRHLPRVDEHRQLNAARTALLKADHHASGLELYDNSAAEHLRKRVQAASSDRQCVEDARWNELQHA